MTLMLKRTAKSLFYFYLDSTSQFSNFSIIICICRLGLHREAEKQFRSALSHQEFVDTRLYLAKVSLVNAQ